MPAPPPSPISPLRGLLEVSRLVRAEGDLPELLAAIARTISEALGYETVVIDLYRPAWDDFCVTTVHGNDGARASLLGQVRTHAEWEPLLSERFHRRGAYVVPAGAYDWTDTGYSYVPDVEPGEGVDAWQPEDALFLPMRHADGHLLGIVSVDEPVTRRRPTDEELEVLASFADHAALAVQSAQEAAEAARHRLALEQLLRVSSRLTDEPAADEILRAVCTGVRDALGFRNVLALLVDPQSSRLEPRAAVGWAIDPPEAGRPVFLADVQPLLDPAFEIEGCFLLPSEAAEQLVPAEKVAYVSQLNGRGPRAWRRHWLVVPLHDRGGGVIGILSADEPEDRLLPSAEKLQALRIFANQAAAAIVASAYVHELRFLADHDAQFGCSEKSICLDIPAGALKQKVARRRQGCIVGHGCAGHNAACGPFRQSKQLARPFDGRLFQFGRHRRRSPEPSVLIPGVDQPTCRHRSRQTSADHESKKTATGDRHRSGTSEFTEQANDLGWGCLRFRQRRTKRAHGRNRLGAWRNRPAIQRFEVCYGRLGGLLKDGGALGKFRTLRIRGY